MIEQTELQNINLCLAYDSIISADYIIPPEWNDITIGLETESEYIFYQWVTTA